MTLRSLLNGTANASMRLYERVGRATSNGRGRRHNRRGMALVVVMAVIVILSVSVVEFIYNTRVNLHLAQNHRDEVKAYFLARSGINLQRLAVGYQFELANQPLVGDAMTRSGFQLWRYTEYLLPTFSTGSIDAGLFGSVDLEAAGAEGFGGIMGDIEFAPVVAEEGKININAFASRQLGLEEVQTLCALLSPPIHDDLLSSEQQQLAESRFEVIAAIIDHVDPDTDLTVLDADCQPSVGGAGNESSRYIDMDWGPKDAALVTLGELLTVPGVNDAFMDRFADNLTVYPVPNKLYINLADAQQIAALLCTNIEGAQVTGFSPCNDQQWASTYGWQVNLLSLAMEGYINYFTNIYTVLGGAVGAGDDDDGVGSMVNAAEGRISAFSSPRRFRQILEGMIQQPEVALVFATMADGANQGLFQLAPLLSQIPQFSLSFDYGRMEQRLSTDVPKVYQISAIGRYGAATREITTVIDYRDPAKPAVMYWREF